MRPIIGYMVKIFWYSATLIWGCLADEPNVGKGKYQGGLGGTGMVKQRDKGIKGTRK